MTATPFRPGSFLRVRPDHRWYCGVSGTCVVSDCDVTTIRRTATGEELTLPTSAYVLTAGRMTTFVKRVDEAAADD